MTLPFEIPNKDKRTYTCFCCAVRFSSLEDYKTHILDNHEEGRDFVKCPLCSFPVRDVRHHCRVKHPGRPMPKNGQMKAIIWKDQQPGKEKLKTRKPKFREGYYESTKMNKKLHYRSGWECQIYECLDADNEIHTFDAEPMEIPYMYKGQAKKYIPDLIVRYVDGRTEMWEIKPSSQTLLEKNQDKWAAAEKACFGRGWTFKVITEKGMDNLKMKVKRQYNENQEGK